ncbi:MAG TPA: HAD-IA family hydrolase [Polyangiaceae bacterium]|nr:HAD-IA family hydrolase [Polyangiaceae bacterium]
MEFDGVDLLSLDAGNTVIFLDHARLETIARELGHEVDSAKLIETEGKAKRAIGGDGDAIEIDWANAKAPGARGWGIVMATMFEAAGVSRGDLPKLLDVLWASHVDHNLYSKVPKGFAKAMAEIRALGVKVAIVSNSEGMLDRLFDKLGILSSFDAVVDSAKVGIEKPDARIFEIACKRTGTTPARALHLGDTMATDIVGARNAKMRCAMVDPFGHYEGMYPDVPRVAGVVEVAREITRSK